MTPCQIQTGPSESCSSVELVQIPPGGIDLCSDLLRKLIEPAIARTRKTDTAAVLGMAKEGRVQVWVLWESNQKEPLGVVVTELVDYASRRVGRVILGAGRLVNLVDDVAGKLEAWARAEGCAALEAVGRRGWGRVRRDYELIESTFSKEL